MLITTSIKRAHLRAALATTSDSVLKPSLNNVFCEVHADRVFLVGTDGYRMGVCRSDGPNTAAGEFLIPRLLAVKVDKAKGRPRIVITFDTETHVVTIDDANTRHTGLALSEKFPDWRRSFPKRTSGAATMFNPVLAAGFGKAAKELGCDSDGRDIRVWPNGTDGAMVQIVGVPDYYGVLMPLRLKGAAAIAPEPSTFADAPTRNKL